MISKRRNKLSFTPSPKNCPHPKAFSLNPWKPINAGETPPHKFICMKSTAPKVRKSTKLPQTEPWPSIRWGKKWTWNRSTWWARLKICLKRWTLGRNRKFSRSRVRSVSRILMHRSNSNKSPHHPPPTLWPPHLKSHQSPAAPMSQQPTRNKTLSLTHPRSKNTWNNHHHRKLQLWDNWPFHRTSRSTLEHLPFEEVNTNLS